VADIICVGVAFLDHVFETREVRPLNATNFADSYYTRGSGTAATGSITVARLDGHASFWGRLGNDETGRRIEAGLRQHGVQTDQTRLIEGAHSPVSSILTDDNGNQIETAFPGHDLEPDSGWLPVERIEDCSAVLVDSRWSEAAARVLQTAHDHRIPAVLDGNADPHALDADFARLASHVVFSPTGLQRFTETRDIQDGLEAAAGRTNALVAVTSGVDGFCWIDGDGAFRAIAPEIGSVIDPLDAREVFLGAFTLALGEGKDIETSACFACATAEITSSRPGGRGAIPHRAEVWEHLARGRAA
jgi:sulfofructose kinase